MKKSVSVNKDSLDTTVKSKAQLANEYGTSVRTFVKWLKDHEIETGRRKLLTSKEVGMAYRRIGVPREDVPIGRVVR